MKLINRIYVRLKRYSWLIHLLIGFINLNLGVFLGLYVAENKKETEFLLLGPSPSDTTLMLLTLLSFSGIVFIVIGLSLLIRRSKEVD
jgi:uncharacterized membrane protein YhaH (DUF805 family)